MRDTQVVLKQCKEYNHQQILNVLKDGFDLLGGLSSFIKAGHTVLIKPDLYNATEPNVAKTTNPSVISALAELIAKIGAKCIIADSPKGDFTQSRLDRVYVKTYMLQASNNGHAILNTNDNITTIINPNGEHSRDIYVIDAINDADVIINVGKLRCDKHLGLIGCAQNLFGIVPGSVKDLVCSRCHTIKMFYNYNIDLYEALENKVILNILDGVVGCESNSDPRILNSILIGQNPYAVDSVALKLINQEPQDSILLNEAVRRKGFAFSVKTIGDSILPLVCTDFNYVVPKENVKAGAKVRLNRKYGKTLKRPNIPAKLCKGCKVCVTNCPMKAIQMQSGELGEHAVVDYSKCISCFKCLNQCPYKIIKAKTPLKYSIIDRKVQKAVKK